MHLYKKSVNVPVNVDGTAKIIDGLMMVGVVWESVIGLVTVLVLFEKSCDCITM